MKYEKQLSAFFAWAFSVAIAMAGVRCMVTGLGLQPENMAGISLACAVTAGACCLCAQFRRGWIVLLCAAAVLGGYLWREGELALQLESLIYRISVIYDRGYRWGVICWSDADLTAVPVDMGVGLIACVCAAVICLNLCAKSSIIPGVIAGFLPLAACMVVTDTTPDEAWLFWLLTGQLLMIVTSAVRRNNSADGLRLTALLLIPAVLMSALTFRLAPSQGYQEMLAGIQNTLMSWFGDFPFIDGPVENPYIPGDGLVTDDTDLTTVGPRTQLYYPVMDVTADYTGALYLRGQAYDDYDGKSWEVSYVTAYAQFDWPGDEGRIDTGTVQISTRTLHNLRYFPYYPANLYWFSEFGRGYLANLESLTQYSFPVADIDEDFFRQKQDQENQATPDDEVTSAPIVIPEGTLSSDAIFDYTTPTMVQNLQLPEETKVAALRYLAAYDLAGLDTSQRANFIRRLVSGSASYSLDTPKMPTGEDDFAIWFLENSDTGYCIHFATAAAVLLRACGIPARYVTGYACQVYAGQSVTVNASKAHAWVEYYDDITDCWRPLDPTPVAAGSTNPNTYDPNTSVTGPTEPTVEETEPPTQSTAPVPTQPVTEPTNPAVTGPTESTAPEDGKTPAPTPETKPDLTPVSIWLGSILAAAALILGQHHLRRQLRKKRMYAGPANAQALARWQEALRYCRILKTRPPEALKALAEKAKYSQHTLSDQELGEFDRWLQKAKTALRQKPLHVRLFWMLTLAVE